MVKMKYYFKGQRRVFAAIVAAILVYLIVNFFGAKFGISEGIERTMIYVIVLSTTVSAFVTKWVGLKLKVSL